jgi:hypothetical protein
MIHTVGMTQDGVFAKKVHSWRYWEVLSPESLHSVWLRVEEQSQEIETEHLLGTFRTWLLEDKPRSHVLVCVLPQTKV